MQPDILNSGGLNIPMFYLSCGCYASVADKLFAQTVVNCEKHCGAGIKPGYLPPPFDSVCRGC